MTFIKPIVAAACTVFSVSALAQDVYPKEDHYPNKHMEEAVPVPPARDAGTFEAEQDRGSQASDYPSEHMNETVTGSGDSDQQRAGESSAAIESQNEISARPTPIAPAAPADPSYVPGS